MIANHIVISLSRELYEAYKDDFPDLSVIGDKQRTNAGDAFRTIWRGRAEKRGVRRVSIKW